MHTEGKLVRLQSADPEVEGWTGKLDVTYDDRGLAQPIIRNGRVWQPDHTEIQTGRHGAKGLEIVVFSDRGPAE